MVATGLFAATALEFSSVCTDLLRKVIVRPFPLLTTPQARGQAKEIRAAAKPLEDAQREAWRLFPGSALRRAQYINQALARHPEADWDAAVEVAANGRPAFRRNTFKSLIATEDRSLNTTVVSSTEQPIEDSDAVIVGFHGVGSSYSHSGTLLNILSLFASRKSSGMRGELNKLLQAENLTVSEQGPARLPRVYAEAWDLPFHGSGPCDPELRSLDNLADWAALRLSVLKKQGKPILLFTRSGSVNLALRIAQRHPDLVDGFLIMSGNFPAPETIYWGEKEAFQRGTSPRVRLNWQGSKAASHWEYNSANQPPENWFNGKPRLLWFGGRDGQTPQGGKNPDAIARWRAVAGPENVVVVPEREHDVMPFTEGNRSQTLLRFVEAYRTILKVLRAE